MKHLRKLLIMLCFVFAITGTYSTTSNAEETMDPNWKDMSLETRVQGTNKVKLTWKKQKGVVGYKIYRSTYNNGSNVKPECIATLSKKKNSFVDKTVKANKEYDYTIYAYYYKNGKRISKYVGDGDISTKLKEPTWEYCDGTYSNMIASPNKISIPIGYFGSEIYADTLGKQSFKPDGIEVFKKIGKKYKSYKKIKIKNKKSKYYFTDTNVELGKLYRYKFRTYKKINGKIVYSKKTKAFPVRAINNKPECDVKIVQPYDTTNQTMVVSITNNEKYGAFDKLMLWDYGYISDNNYYYVTFEDDFTLVDNVVYSYDQIDWKKDIYNCKIQPGETVYFLLQAENVEVSKKDKDHNSETFSVSFNYGQIYSVNVDLDVQTGKLYMTNGN